MHRFCELLSATLGPARRAGEGEYLSLLDRRLHALEGIASGAGSDRAALGLGRTDRAVARRILRRYEGRWHDGDENLVRGWLDKWAAPGEGPTELARRLSATADALVRIRPRRETLWFFLWELESLLPDLAPAARKPPRGRQH